MGWYSWDCFGDSQVLYETAKKPQKTSLWSIVVTYIFVCFAWIFFRADSFSQAVSLIVRTVTVKSGVHQIYSWTFLAVLFAVFEIAYSVRISKRAQKEKSGDSIPDLEFK